ncbi:hypothetical protein JCM17846_31480 [Iodidimonas nitroreducens]|uniref:Phage portal protein n=1 Tax=Iodidimonas nitroreducens TaxID=1236968 RepID=A0A5A7NET4_9PROT|nr:phage portal protein [Iodidimonas nitroreducens]GAK34497.1 putative protein [alpha proteobacterium Q-1]GER05466.1 hypothetical protein JCM17846_31480 [Iodidimonas nitroreducens]
MSFISTLRQRLGIEEKASAVAGTDYAAGPSSRGYRHGTAWLSNGTAQWSPRTYPALVENGFCKNVVANRSVRLIAQCAASVPVRLLIGEREIRTHPVLDLLARPNPGHDGISFLEQIYSWLQLAGNAYIERVDSPSGRAAELYALRPDRLTIEPGPKGWPAAYLYRVGGHEHRFGVHPQSGRSAILHLKSFHPTDDHYGLSPLQVAAMATDIHAAASGWTKALLDNAARPSGALVFEPGDGMPGNLSDEQIIRLKAEMEAQFQGAANAGRPLLLEGGLRWQSMAFSPADMDFINSLQMASREIALAFGVPPMLLGIPGDNTYANYQEANRALWRLTLLPLVDRVLAGLSRFLSGDGEPLRLLADRDAIPALAIEREALWARVGLAGFMTLNEQRTAVGLSPIAGGDVLAADHGETVPPFERGGRPSAARQMKGQAGQFEDRPDLDPVIVKIWRTQSDGAVRESHRAADGQIVLEHELFQVGEAQLNEPRDPKGPPEETINCRCGVEYVPFLKLTEDQQQELEDRAKDYMERLRLENVEAEKPSERELGEIQSGKIDIELFDVWAPPVIWGAWTHPTAIIARNVEVILLFEMETISDAPSGFEADVVFIDTAGQMQMKRFSNPGTFSITVGGAGENLSQPRFRLRSFSFGQIVRVKVISRSRSIL